VTTTEKVRLVDQHRDDRGLNRCLEAIGLPKSTYGDVSSPAYRQKRPDGPSEEDQRLMSCIREIIDDHPEHGYRRILSELEERTGQRVNHKRPWTSPDMVDVSSL